MDSSHINNLTLVCMAFGCLIGLLSILVSLATLYGLIGVAIGAAFCTLGIGLWKYKMWAWYLAVVVLVPLNVIGGVLGLVFMAEGIVTATPNFASWLTTDITSPRR